MQFTQKHAFWRITRQNRSNGLTPSGAKERTKNKQKIKKAQTINISPLRGDHAPEPIDMPFSVLTLVTDVIIPAKFYVDPLRGFWEGAPPKVPFPILFGTTVTTVLHYRADCEKGSMPSRSNLHFWFLTFGHSGAQGWAPVPECQKLQM